ncbi:hypothetical protein HK096_010245 [Nowakowskiella sp. JEL0078]|nr:hypothetical protein HK096_010245 [Nowakowskiella sp. JEL0078]
MSSRCYGVKIHDPAHKFIELDPQFRQGLEYCCSSAFKSSKLSVQQEFFGDESFSKTDELSSPTSSFVVPVINSGPPKPPRSFTSTQSENTPPSPTIQMPGGFPSSYADVARKPARNSRYGLEENESGFSRYRVDDSSERRYRYGVDEPFGEPDQENSVRDSTIPQTGFTPFVEVTHKEVSEDIMNEAQAQLILMGFQNMEVNDTLLRVHGGEVDLVIEKLLEMN